QCIIVQRNTTSGHRLREVEVQDVGNSHIHVGASHWRRVPRQCTTSRARACRWYGDVFCCLGEPESLPEHVTGVTDHSDDAFHVENPWNVRLSDDIEIDR